MDVDFGGGGGTPTTAPTSSTPTSTPTETPTGGTDCAAWDAAAVYTAGDTVTHNGTTYRAGWWTTGEEPGTTGEWGVWKQTAAC
ncbi:carbohydrate-binding protein [Glycomyces sp. NPDC048151]|uniref:carbohydrate-binding protein n=1 Tax=Glycomyces sp. NPDC048151 TaxID=3364002 RepID=UPI00371807F9